MTPAEIEALLNNQVHARERGRAGKKQSTLSETHQLGGRLIPFPGRPMAISDLVDAETYGDEAPFHAWRASVRIELPLPPSWNSLIRARSMPGPAGRAIAQVYKSKEARQYSELARAYCETHVPAPFPAEQMLSVAVELFMPRAGCDIENRLKTFFDSLQGHLYANDSQIAEYSRVTRVVDSKNPHIVATFSPIAVDKYGNPTEPT